MSTGPRRRPCPRCARRSSSPRPSTTSSSSSTRSPRSTRRPPASSSARPRLLKQNSARIQEQSASATISIESLQKAFANIYETMDTIDQFKVRALDNMAATIGTLETEVAKSRTYLERVATQDARRADNVAPGAARPRHRSVRGRVADTATARRRWSGAARTRARVPVRRKGRGESTWESGRGSGWTGPRHRSRPCAPGRRRPSSCSARSTPSSSRPATARCPASCSRACCA